MPLKLAIVGIICLEGEAHGQMRQMLPASAMLAALIESPDPVRVVELHRSLVKDYALPRTFTEEEVRRVAESLRLEGVVAFCDDALRVEDSARQRYLTRVNEKRADLHRLVSRIARLCTEEGIARRDLGEIEAGVEGVLSELFRRHGTDVADSVLSNRPLVQDLAAAVKDATQAAWPRNRTYQTALQRALLRVFRDPRPEDGRAIFWLCQTYFLIGAYTIDPEGSILSKGLFTDVRLWLDSNIILPILADYHPLQSIYSNMLQGSAAQGAHLLVLTNVLDEVYGNAQRAWQIATELSEDAVAMDVYVESLGWERANVFVVGYARARRAGKSPTWNEYTASTGLPRPGNRAFKAGLRALVERKLRAEVVPNSLGSEDMYRVEPLTATMEKLRKAAWQFRHRVLCRNEAVQVLQVYHDRRLSTRSNGGPAAWFITTDGFVNQLYQHHVAEWGLPCAQHPIRWFQLLEAVSASTAAYKGFSRLFLNVALTAYREGQVRRLLTAVHVEYQELMKKRPEEVRALFLRVLKDYATRADELERAVSDRTELSVREEEALSAALDRFREDATRLFGEYDELELELKKARATVEKLEGELRRRGSKELKKPYLQRQLKRQVREQQQRITELERALRDAPEQKR